MAQEPEAKPSAPLIDWAALSKRYGNRQDFIDKLLRMSYASHADMLAKLRSAIQKRDSEAIAFIAHGIRGTASNLEAKVLRDWAAETEASVREGQPEPITLAEELARILEHLLTEIARYLENGSGSQQ